jgi:acid phosphatase type 7
MPCVGMWTKQFTRQWNWAVGQGQRCCVLIAATWIYLPAPATAQTSQPAAGQSSPVHNSKQESALEQPAILVGAGDIAGCKALAGAEATAKLIEKIPGTVFAAGDLAYERGTPEEFEKCYGSTWGHFKNRTRPALGNHEYGDPTASEYFTYWGKQAGPAPQGYYSYELGSWHVVVLNTNCDAQGLGGCGAGSPQENWLKKDLSEHKGECIVAYGHHALFSSGIFKSHAVHLELRQLWDDLYTANADLVLAGHEHSYERFAPQDSQGRLDPVNGIRQIVVGTGGRSHDPLGFAMANSEAANVDTFGVLKLTLFRDHYTWEFIPEEGKTFRDSGSAVCHNQAPHEANILPSAH